MTEETLLLQPPAAFKAGEELRRRLLEAASRLFAQYGYEGVSIRQIALAAGCSTMAMYRHFPDKHALMRHLCVGLYRRFTTELHHRFDELNDPRERLRNSLRHFVLLSAENPHHFRLIFLTRSEDERTRDMRSEASGPALEYFRQNLRQCLPASASEAMLEERLRQIIAVLHGICVMLITFPEHYALNLETALASVDSAFSILVNAPAIEPEAR